MMISMSAMLSDEPGTYILILKSAVTRRVRVGRLGNLQLCAGYYVYIGSAFGPGGLRARIDHHSAWLNGRTGTSITCAGIHGWTRSCTAVASMQNTLGRHT